jgi:hypothetical protein
MTFSEQWGKNCLIHCTQEGYGLKAANLLSAETGLALPRFPLRGLTCRICPGLLAIRGSVGLKFVRCAELRPSTVALTGLLNKNRAKHTANNNAGSHKHSTKRGQRRNVKISNVSKNQRIFSLEGLRKFSMFNPIF